MNQRTNWEIGKLDWVKTTRLKEKTGVENDLRKLETKIGKEGKNNMKEGDENFKEFY